MEKPERGKATGSAGASKSPLQIGTLLDHLLSDLGSCLPIDENDKATLRRRLLAEGPKFAFVGLKSVQDLLLDLLEFGCFPAKSDFSTLPGSRIPKFLGGLWKAIMGQNGELTPGIENSVVAIESIRALLQVSASFSKYADSVPTELSQRYYDEFVAVDEELANVLLPADLTSAAANVITDIFKKFTLRDIRPIHGPGAVASGERDEGKWVFKRLFEPAHQVYPWYEYFVPSLGMGRWEPEFRAWWNSLQRLSHSTAKFILVPKSSTSLRGISVESLEMQYLQQGQLRLLVQHLQSHWLTKGHVNFSDQTVNQHLALVNSATRRFATLDLSSASDRLSLSLVQSLFRNVEDNVLRYLMGTRSTHTALPDGRVVEMRKFAPMGSATCFPVQSVSFYALVTAAIAMHGGLPMNEASQLVYVYGDDIICPVEYVDCVVVALESVGLKVNYRKSYHRGSFRESCGVFAFAGVDITPVRFKTTFPHSRSDGRGISAWVSYAHDCETKGLTSVAEYIYSCLEEVTGKLPYGLPGASYFCRLAHSMEQLMSHTYQWPHYRYNERLQEFQIQALGLASRKRDAEFETPFHRLLRGTVEEPNPDRDPSVIAVARSAKSKTGWHLVF